jgi:hypothetical protein
VRADFGQTYPKIVDKSQQWLAHVAFISLFVGLEPFRVVVFFKLPQKCKKFRGDIGTW